MIVNQFKQLQNVIALTIDLYGYTFREVSERAETAGYRVGPSTVSRLYHGKTNSPHFRTVMGVLTGVGYKVHITSRTKVAQLVFDKVPWR